MKKLMIACVLLLSQVSFAQDYEIKITNQSDLHVELGKYSGIMLPSLCEDGFCWEEAFVKFRAFNRSLRNIQDTESITLNYEELYEYSATLKLKVPGQSNDHRIELISCLDSDLISYPRTGSTIEMNFDSRNDYCIDPGTTHIIIKE